MRKAIHFPRWDFLVTFSLVVGTFPREAAPQPSGETEMIESAQRALRTYTTQIVDENNYAEFGFRSFDEAARARLGTPLPIILIGLSDLKSYTLGTSVRQLGKDAGAVWFPVIVGNEVRATLEMVKQGSNWAAGEFGRAKTAAAFGGATADLSSKLGALSVAPPRTLSLVRVPTLNSAFLFVESPSGEYLIPATTGSQKFNLEVGQIYPAGDVLQKLVEYSSKIDPTKVGD